MKLSPVVFMQRVDLKEAHDALARAWADGDSQRFEEAMELLRKEIATVPRKKYGTQRVYDTNGEQPAWVALHDPAAMDIECID